jgi:ADP-dependent NAD(P)H-hydrate dehydratase / NAD(P)H-hydrate epimerase
MLWEVNKMRLVTVDEMRALEQAADDAGLSYAEMMERAGRAVAEAIEGVAPRGAVLVLAGPGNNGGDGLVAARILVEWGYTVSVVLWQRDQEEDAPLVRAREADLPILHWTDMDKETLAELVRDTDVIVDALLGTGAKGPLRGGLPELLEIVNTTLQHRAADSMGEPDLSDLRDAPIPDKPFLVAVDVPSGLNVDNGEIDQQALKSDITVTFAYPKRGHYLHPGAAHVGTLYVADIGIGDVVPDAGQGDFQVVTASEVASLLPRRPRSAHKGSFGKAMIVAGSVNYTGAPCLAAEAAYRIGAGLVTLGVPQAIHAVVAARVLEATHLLLPHTMGVLRADAERPLRDHLEGYAALLVGPGLGHEKETGEFLSALLVGQRHAPRKPVGFQRYPAAEDGEPKDNERSLPPLVLDADALNLLADMPFGWAKQLPQETVLTPHPGEMARLIGGEVQDVTADRLGMARDKAVEWGCTLVLKGAYTVVASVQGQVKVIPFATPALATAGTGDVLAGAIVGLMAQGLSGFDAAVCGTYLHGFAGELAEEQNGSAGTIASDLLPLLPEVLRRLALP